MTVKVVPDSETAIESIPSTNPLDNFTPKSVGTIMSLEGLRPPPKYKSGWGAEVYKLLCSTNTDNDGGLSSTELWECLAMMPIRIASLKPKPDKKTNSIDPTSLDTFDALVKADVDGDGCLEAHELITIVNSMRSAKKSAARLKKVVFGLALLILLLLGCIGGIVGGVVFGATSALPQATSGGVSLDTLATRRRLSESFNDTGGAVPTGEEEFQPAPVSQSSVAKLSTPTGTVLATAESLEAAPLYVAPVLPYEALRRVKILDVTYKRGRNIVKTAMHVHSMNLLSRTAVEFEGDGGRRVSIVNGTAMYLIISSRGTPQSFVVCAADVQCSSLTVSVSELDEYVEEAIRELRAVGLAAEAEAIASADERRRRLWGMPNWVSQPLDFVCDAAVTVFDAVVEVFDPPAET